MSTTTWKSTCPSEPPTGSAPAASPARARSEGVAVGIIIRARGLRGEVIVESWSDLPERFQAGAVLRVDRSAGEGVTRLEIDVARQHQGRLLIRFRGIGDRESAKRLRGLVLKVPREWLPDAPDGSYYHFELVGCRVFDDQEGDLGEVIAVIEDGGGTLLEIAQGGRALLVPFVSAYLCSVKVEDRRIETRLPPGLVEQCASTF